MSKDQAGEENLLEQAIVTGSWCWGIKGKTDWLKSNAKETLQQAKLIQ